MPVIYIVSFISLPEQCYVICNQAKTFTKIFKNGSLLFLCFSPILQVFILVKLRKISQNSISSIGTLVLSKEKAGVCVSYYSTRFTHIKLRVYYFSLNYRYQFQNGVGLRTQTQYNPFVQYQNSLCSYNLNIARSQH